MTLLMSFMYTNVMDFQLLLENYYNSSVIQKFYKRLKTETKTLD